MTDEWRTMPFPEAVLVNPSVLLEKGKSYPFVDMKTIDPYRRDIVTDIHREYSGGGSRFKSGDTLMARITPCLENGKTARYIGASKDTIAHGSTEFIVIRGRPNISDSSYAYYLTIWDGVRLFAISKMTGTSGRQRVPTESLKHLDIQLPPLDEQKAIAHILGTLDDKIELNRRMNETLEEIAQAIFKSWFIDFDPVRAKSEDRDTGLPKHIADLFPDSLDNSELGEIPKEWGVRPIGEVVRCVGGSTPSTKETAYWENGTTPFVTPRDMSSLNAPVVLDTERRITGLGVDKISSGCLPAGTVLLSSRAPIGYLAITDMPVSINQGIIAMICDGLLPRQYVTRWVESNMEIIKANAGGTTFAEISKGNFRNILAIIPSEEILSVFSSCTEHLYLKIVNNVKGSRTLSMIRDTLLPQLVSGQLRINDAEKFLERAV